MLVVDFGKLVGGARPKAFAFGARDVGVVELTVEPQLGGQRAGLARAHLHLQGTLVQGTLALTRHSVAQGVPPPPFQAPSSRIICTSMPSRRPRSATRRRRHGKARRIASRMAQPASTRSARSAPMQALATRSS